MKITVAIPCYNLEERIATCLESVISQDFQEMEILIIDDHSTDRSVEIVREIMMKHPEREFHFIVNENNLGISIVRNMAIDEAKGEALFFVDGDDTIEPGTLSLFHRRMEETDVEIVCGSFRKKDFNGKTYIIKQFPEDTIKGEFAYATYIERYIKGYFCVAVWNKLYRLDFLKSNDICCSTHYRIYEDVLFTFKVVMSASSISYIHDVTYNYCDCPTSICHQRVVNCDFFQHRSTVIASVFAAKKEFEISHHDVLIPRGIWFYINYICLTSGSSKFCMESNISKKEKKRYLSWLKEIYHKNGVDWSHVVGPFNKISYLILISPFSYSLFRFYFKHLKAIAGIVSQFTNVI